MKRRVAALLAAGAAAAFMGGAAAAMEIRGGLLRQDAVTWWAAGSRFEKSWALNAEAGFDPLGRVLGGEIAPMAGVTWAPGEEVDFAYAGLNWTLSAEQAFLRLGLGGAVHNGDIDDPEDYDRRRQFGSRLLFHVPAEIGLRISEQGWISAYYVHVSNGNLADINPGMDSIGVRVGYRFR